MKNKTVNKKVLRAMSIGLAAMMTVQPILATPVFADDTEPVDDAGSSVEATVESSSAETTTESSSEPAPTVENVADSYSEASSATGDIKASLDQAVSAGRDSDEFASFDQNNGGELTNLNNAVVDTVIGAVDAETLNANRAEVSDAAIQLVEDAKRDDRKDDKKFEVDADELLKGQVNTDIKNIETAENNLNDAINVQDTALDELNKKIEITNKFTGTDGFINIETGKIEDATSIPAATESLGAATALKDGADKKFEDSKAAYDKAADDYKTAKAELDKKQQAYNDALNAAVADESALANAKAELETAQKDCETLETEISEAQTALSNSAIGKLASALEKTKENANDWSSLDLIMKDVIKYYYFPSIGVNAADVKIDDQFTKNSALADGTKNERANYIKATVGEKVYYLNYICEKDGTPDNKINNDGRYPKMVIFEKNPELIEEEHYEDGNSKYDVNKVTKNAVKADENGVLSLAVDPVNGSYILNGTTYYVVNQSENVTVDNKLEEGDTAANTNTSYSLNEDGDVVKTIKGDVTKTEIAESASLVESDTNMTLVDAKNAAEKGKSSSQVYVDSDNNKYKFVDDVLYKILENNELEKVTDDITVTAYQDVSDTYSVDASAKATVDFTSTFTTRVSLKGLRTEVSAIRTGKGEQKEALQEINRKVFGDTESGFWHKIEEIFEDEKSKGVLGEIKNAINGAGYTVTGLSFNKVSHVEQIKDDSWRFNYYDALDGSLSVTFTKSYKTTAVSGTYSNSGVSASDIDGLDAISLAETAAKANAENNKVKNADELVGNETFSNAVAKIIVDVIKKQANNYGLRELSFSTMGSSTVEDKDKREYGAAKVSTNGTATYGYNVNGTKVSKSYDTDATVSTAVFNTDELTYVDKKYAAIPLLNDNYYNYKKDNDNKDGILADLRKTDSEIYQKLMTDVNKFNDLAAKYEEAKNNALAANDKVKYAQEKVDALIKSINALRANSDSEYEKKLAGLKAKLDEALENLNKATEEKKAVDEAYGRALEAYEDAVARLTPAPATGDEETAPTAGGGTTTAPAPTVVTTLAGTPVFALPTGGVAAPAAGVAGARTSRGAAIDSDSAAADTEDTTAKIAPTKEVEEDALAITKDTIKTIKDNETPLSSLTEDSTQKMNWWWLLLIALLGATGEEIYRRNKKKKEEEAALKAEIDKE